MFAEAWSGMSDSDSFIQEVTEEVRRDRLFALYRRYGWIAVLAVILLVGGVGWREFRQARDISAARAFGDSVLAARQEEDIEARIDAYASIDPPAAGGVALVAFLRADAQIEAGNVKDAVKTLGAVAEDGEVGEIYRQIAAFKMLSLQSETLAAAERRAGFENLATPGAPLRLLAEEQLAVIDIEEGRIEEARERLQAILQDADLSDSLSDRAGRLITALEGISTSQDQPQE